MNPNETPVAEASTGSSGLLAPPKRRGIAPVWHTIVLAAVFVLISAAGANSQHTYAEHRGRLVFYLTTMAAEWLVVAFVMWGVHKRGLGLRELTGGRWAQPEDALLDVAIAVGFWIGALVVLALVAFAIGLAAGTAGAAGSGAAKLAERCAELKRTVGFLAPDGRLEILVWLATSATAGFCEEIIFRGYFQRQFTALSGFAVVGLLGQALLFGASHGYEGASRMGLIGVYALLFGGLALWRHSLRPGMIAHALHDGVMGILIRPLLRVIGC